MPAPTILALPDGDTVRSRPRYAPTKAILAGSRNSAALASSGALYTWGWNSHDTLGHDVDDEWIPRPRAVAAVQAASRRAASDDGARSQSSRSQSSADVPTGDRSDAACASLGGWHACAADRDGRLFAWGGNEYGQAGVDTGTAGQGVHVSLHLSIPELVSFPAPDGLASNRLRITQVACGGMCSFAVVERTGEVYTWGQTVGSEKAPVRSPVRVPGIRGVSTLAAGMFHALALQEDGRVLAWGNGDYGQLGLGRPGNEDTPTEVEALSRAGVRTVAAGGWHSAAVTAGGVCYVWGRGEYGRLGLGDGDCADKQRPVELTLGSWGDVREGGGGGRGGGSVPRIVDAALGGTHSCLLDESGRVYSFGRNSLGRLGRVVSGKWSGDPAPVRFPPAPGGGAWRVTSVCAGGRHTMATARVRSKERVDAEEAAAQSGGSRPRSPLVSQSPSRRTSVSVQQ